ncbi:hypothetical protein SAMN04488564_102281 [Lentzea waywayandensis]|uniref:DUF7336 domain-containing protein n=1 Tax=Lentzea waywayandensis TaxID=84724 RepID=A0A1I6DCP1_9PSEU|nr:hypothetical protein [Lentzea waywayandensis]SFR03230.1 hypothetical protein SAMN04488564_102281 [Lentzea waywayandensis]
MSDRVFLLWHVHHVAQDASGETRHFSVDGEFWADEEEGDDVKLLGVYSTREKAMARIDRARRLAGFRDEPECFHIDEYALDEAQWTDGFTTI